MDRLTTSAYFHYTENLQMRNYQLAFELAQALARLVQLRRDEAKINEALAHNAALMREFQQGGWTEDEGYQLALRSKALLDQALVTVQLCIRNLQFENWRVQQEMEETAIKEE